MKNVAYIFIAISVIIPGKSMAAAFPEVDIHGFISQGYLLSSENNYIADSKDGTFEFNELGINFGTNPLPGLFLGVQLFANDLGKTGNDELTLDWAVADYKWRPYLGLKAGKLKLPYGLYNDTRDIDMLRVSILLPQSVYLEIQRESMNGLNGGGVYGKFPVPFIGKISYEVLAGTMNISKDGSLAYYIESIISSVAPISINITKIDVNSFFYYSATLHTNLRGLLFKYSGSIIDINVESIINAGYQIDRAMDPFQVNVYSVQYSFHNFLFTSECLLIDQKQRDKFYVGDVLLGSQVKNDHMLGNYASISWSINELFELEYYYSQFFTDRNDKKGKNITPSYSAYQKDHCLALRYNINSYWIVKVEGHLISGVGLLNPSENPPGSSGNRYTKNWSLLALKLSYRF